MRGFLLTAFALLFIGCNKWEEPKPLTPAEVDKQSRVIEAMQQMAPPTRLSQTNAQAVIRKAYDDFPPLKEEKDSKRIGVDVVFRTDDGELKVDLDHIHAIEGGSGMLAPAHPTVQRLTHKGDPAADNDPTFAGEEDFRCLLIYSVPKDWKSVKLEYWGDLLTPEPITLEHGAPALPDTDLAVKAIMQESRDDTTSDAYLLQLECREWSRVDLPRAVEMRCLDGAKRAKVQLEALVEVDEKLQPHRQPLQDRALYVPVRLFLARFRCPEGATVLDIKTSLGPRSLPPLKPFDVPQETLTELTTATAEPALAEEPKTSTDRPMAEKRQTSEAESD